MRRILFTFLLIFLLLTGAGLAIIFSGFFNVAASEPHSALARWILNTTMRESVKRRAQGVEPPAGRADRVQAGFAAYDEMCVTCHGAPGVEPSVLGKGLMPPAPDLTEAAEEWQPAELFWIVKHGIKMTGMPAWAKTHSDEQLWEVVAFLERLPATSAKEYLRLRQRQAAATEAPHGHTH